MPNIDFKCDGNPIDTLVLSMFMGKIPEENIDVIGQPFLNLTWLESQYNMVHSTEPTVDINNFEGQMSTTFWYKKS